jgi:hypothetical protein
MLKKIVLMFCPQYIGLKKTSFLNAPLHNMFYGINNKNIDQ